MDGMVEIVKVGRVFAVVFNFYFLGGMERLVVKAKNAAAAEVEASKAVASIIEQAEGENGRFDRAKRYLAARAERMQRVEAQLSLF